MKNFENLSIYRQRMAIIKDTIAQIQAKKFFTRNGSYFVIDNEDKLGLKEAIQESNCYVCGIGGLFGACVLNTNGVKVNENYSSEEYTIGKLSPWFDRKELLLIECAFELGIVGDCSNDRSLFIAETFDELGIGAVDCGNMKDSTRMLEEGKKYLKPETLKAIRFGRRYRNATNRYLAILNNMLSNKGKFKP